MPQEKVQNLMSELHELFGTGEPSAEQANLLKSLDYYLHEQSETTPPDPSPIETLELLAEQMGDQHPRASGILRELMETLKNMGV